MKDKIPKIIEKELQAKVLEIKRIAEGFSHFMYEVTVDREPFRVIVRFSNNTEKTSNLGKEKYVMDLLKENRIPSPKILAFHFPENKEEGYMIMEKHGGIRLDTIWDELETQEKKKVATKMGKLLAKIHEIKFEEYGEIEEDGTIDSDKTFKFRSQGEKLPHSPFIRQNLKDVFKFLSRLLSFKIVNPEFAPKITNYFSKQLEEFDYEGKPTLNHGDFMPGHLFVEKINQEYEITGIIDFEFALASSPEFDFIKLHRAGFFKDKEIKQALEAGYGKINEKAIEILRMGRDLGFAWVVLEAGNNDLAEKTLKEMEEKIDKVLTNA